MDVETEVERHRAAGRSFDAAGVRSFVLDDGPRDGPVVLCLHGVPVSSYLYRKILPRLAAEGLRGVAFDLPGLGLAERPEAFDYAWSGLGRYACAAVDALGLDRFHLVVHDIGGPIGFELAAAMPDRVASLTLLDTIVDVARFRQPFPMWPFGVPVLDRVWLGSINRFIFRQLMAQKGVRDLSRVPAPELGAHLALLRREDGGRAFLRIMKGFETTAEKQARYREVVRGPYPVQIVWFRHDPALPYARYGREAEAAAGVPATLVDGMHFAQEDNDAAVTSEIVAFVKRVVPGTGLEPALA